MTNTNWISSELSKHFPNATLTVGVDLDRNGTIAQNERTDRNGDHRVDDGEWQKFMINNRDALTKLGGRFGDYYANGAENEGVGSLSVAADILGVVLLGFLKIATAPLWMAGCSKSVDVDQSNYGNQNVDAGPDGDADIYTDGNVETDTDISNDPAAALVGRWGQLVNMAYLQTGLPVVGSQWIASRNWYLTELTNDGHGNVTAHEQLCAVKFKLEENYSIIVPQNLIDHVSALERHVTVDSNSPGTPWVSDIVYEVRGANLCDEVNDPLPTNFSASGPDESISCDQPCTGWNCDQDEDGHPGVTNILVASFISVSCETYITQRWRARLNGKIIDVNTIAGSITDSFTEQTIVESNDINCDLVDLGTDSANCPEHQYFKMVRLDDDATCIDVMALTDCDENEESCDYNSVMPLDPANDQPGCN